MDWEHAKINAETTYIRSRGWIRTLFRFAGIALVLVGTYNLLLAPVLDAELVLAFYRDFIPNSIVVQEGFVQVGDQIVRKSTTVYVADVALMALGAVVAWFV